VLDAAGEGYRAAVVSCLPKVGKSMCGRVFIGKWHPTSAHRSGQRSKMPIRSSNVKELISSQTKRSIANITLDIVAGGRKAISDAFLQVKEDIVVFDAVTDDDIENIASALSDQEKIICVDPGPFTAAFIEQKMDSRNKTVFFLFLVVFLNSPQLN